MYRNDSLIIISQLSKEKTLVIIAIICRRGIVFLLTGGAITQIKAFTNTAVCWTSDVVQLQVNTNNVQGIETIIEP
jgi:hypothetical protein